MPRFLKVILFVGCFVFSKSNFSQDIRAAWIDYKWMSGYTYSITASLLTNPIISDNHCKITLSPCGNIYRENGLPAASTAECPISFDGTIINITPLVRKSIYSCIHVFSGPGYYKLYLADSLRTSGIKNIPNSQSKTFYVESLLSINQFMGPNSSPVSPSNPIAFTGVSGNNVLYNPSLIDPDGDSLSYQLTNCQGTFSTSIYHYIPSNANVDLYGTLSFSKDSVGLYAFSYLIKEWRKDFDGVFQNIGSKQMDFAMNIDAGVGIKEFDKKESIKIYPNPTSNILKIKSNSKTNSTIEIMNSIGQTVLKQNYSESVDVSNMESGYYILKITGSENYYSKFIKE